MGVNTWAAFAGNDDRGGLDGDFAMRKLSCSRSQSATRGGHQLVAIHHHMTMKTPRTSFCTTGVWARHRRWPPG